MSRSTAENRDLEYGEETEPLNRDSEGSNNADQRSIPTRSIYALSREEIARGLANRFVHSRTYIFLYLIMAALSVATVVLSLTDECPGLVFYILEVIVNTTMILEVGTRFVALGKQFWKSPFNVVDLILTLFCAVTLVVLAFARCGSGSKEEEIFDTLLLVARNVLQFGRLASVMRQSGQSIFSRPKPIDISTARRARFIDLEIEREDDSGDETVVRNPILFEGERREEVLQKPFTDMPRAGGPPDAEDAWANIG